MRSRAERSAAAGTATGGTWPSWTRASIPSTALRSPSTDCAPSTSRPRSGGRLAAWADDAPVSGDAGTATWTGRCPFVRAPGTCSSSTTWKFVPPKP